MRFLFRPSGIAAVLALVLFFAANAIFERTLSGVRLDLTEDRLFTISEGTRTVLEELKDPIELVYFFSETVARDYPQFFTYGRRIRDMLREYAAIGGGKVRLEIVDPEPFTPEEDRAVAAGMQGIPTASGEQIYMGLLARDLTDRERAIPFFSQDRQDFLEYDLTKLIAGLAEEERPRLALLTSLPMAPGAPQPLTGRPARGWVIYDQLSQLFDLYRLEPNFTEIPDDTDLLIVVHPPALSDAALYAIDQFVLGGGRAAVFVDPYSDAAGAGSPMAGPAPESSTLDPLLGAWGLDLVDEKIVGDVELAQRVNMGGGGPRAVRDLPIWIAARGDAIAGDDPVTANLEQINLATAGALIPVEGAEVLVEPLVRSSAVSALMEAGEARGLPDPDALLRKLEPDAERYTLIARVTGEVASAFPDGPPEPSNGEETGETTDRPPHLARSQGPIAVLVGADSDLFDDRFWVQVQDFFGQRIIVPVADNASLLINALDHLAGSEALIALRGRGVTDRPFEIVDRIRRKAEARFRAEEERLKQELAATEARLAELQSQIGEGEMLFSPEQDAEMQRFRERLLEVRQQLRTVQRNLVEDIERLGTWLRVINIALVPALLTAIALTLAALRRHRRARRLGA